MIKQIFTWWNSQTLGTFIYTLFFGKYVGKDDLGNKYYENKRKQRRWVIYSGEINASKITADWYSWIHHISNTTPEEKKLEKFSWQKPHEENKTGRAVCMAKILPVNSTIPIEIPCITIKKIGTI